MTAKLSGRARSDALATLKGWTEVSGRDAIHKSLKFADFSQPGVHDAGRAGRGESRPPP